MVIVLLGHFDTDVRSIRVVKQSSIQINELHLSEQIHISENFSHSVGTRCNGVPTVVILQFWYTRLFQLINSN